MMQYIPKRVKGTAELAGAIIGLVSVIFTMIAPLISHGVKSMSEKPQVVHKDITVQNRTNAKLKLDIKEAQWMNVIVAPNSITGVPDSLEDQVPHGAPITLSVTDGTKSANCTTSFGRNVNFVVDDWNNQIYCSATAAAA